ncbi:MAG: hypothetical protein LC808_08870, partial [Actinobacteria bacterium]|nr:hypothetical protein [Actinomycetota bacterium]
MTAGDDRIGQLVDDLVTERLDRRTFLRRAAALGLSAPAAGALLAACGGKGGGEASETTKKFAKRAEKLTVQQSADIINLDPAFYSGGQDEAVFSSINEGLITYKPGTFEVVNQLAEKFEPSSDGLTYDFTLKQGIP